MDSSKIKVLSIVQNNPGDISCYLMFWSKNQLEAVTKMLSKSICFNPRESIVRGETVVNEVS